MSSPDLAAAADALERAAAQAEQVDPLALQRAIAAVTRLYVARLEAGDELAPFPPAGVAPTPTATETLVLVSELLKASEIELFELGMWQVWGGVRGG